MFKKVLFAALLFVCVAGIAGLLWYVKSADETNEPEEPKISIAPDTVDTTTSASPESLGQKAPASAPSEEERISPLNVSARSLPTSDQIYKELERRAHEGWEEIYLDSQRNAGISDAASEPAIAVSPTPTAPIPTPHAPSTPQPSPTQETRNPPATNPSGLTDQEIFNTIYPAEQLEIFEEAQDGLIFAGFIKEEERVIFDSEKKIRDFMVRAMPIVCKEGFLDPEETVCGHWDEVGLDPWLSLKKIEEDSLRRTGKLPTHILSLSYYRQFVDRQTLARITGHTRTKLATIIENKPKDKTQYKWSAHDEEEDAPAEYYCPTNPETFSYENIGKFSFSGVIQGIADFISGKPAQAHIYESYGICWQAWYPIPHKHVPAIGCGQEWGITLPKLPGLLWWNPCCHCHIQTGSLPGQCSNRGCLSNTCKWVNEALHDNITGICGCGFF